MLVGVCLCVCKWVCVLGALESGGFLLVSAPELQRERGVQGRKMGKLGLYVCACMCVWVEVEGRGDG